MNKTSNAFRLLALASAAAATTTIFASQFQLVDHYVEQSRAEHDRQQSVVRAMPAAGGESRRDRAL